MNTGSARYLVNKWGNRPEFEPLYDVISNRLTAGLRRLGDMGYDPDWVVDAGAYKGEWTAAALRFFPRASFLMLEAQAEKAPFLDIVRLRDGRRIKYFIGLLGAREAERAEFYLAETGSSSYVENTAFAREKTTLPMTTLDSVFEKEEVRGSVFLKLDVQGAELDVLDGSKRVLSGADGTSVDVILMEVSLANYNEGAPRVAPIVAYMAKLDYELWDIWDLRRIWNNSTSTSILAQADFVFVKCGSRLAAKSHDIVRNFGGGSGL